MLAFGMLGGAAGGPRLASETTRGWHAYAAAVEARRAAEAGDGTRFLVLDFGTGAAADREALRAGRVVVHEMPHARSEGRELDVPGGLVHHWRGAVLVPGVTVDELIDRIQFADPPAIQDDVLRSAVLGRGVDSARVFLRLRRTKIVTAVFNTEHDVRFVRISRTRAASTSVATKIAEVRDPDSPSERELTFDEDRGFLWGLNAYWRYEATSGGVVAECESITLSRPVPVLLRYIAGPLISSAAEESMTRTLESVRKRYRGGGYVGYIGYVG